jgi:hypothetical protein
MIFLAAVGLTEHANDDESAERIDPGGRSAMISQEPGIPRRAGGGDE